MIQQKKTYRFSDDTVITEQNIRQIGELIALSSVRTRMIHSTRDLYYVFQNLYKDIYCHTERIILTQTAHLRQMALRRVLVITKHPSQNPTHSHKQTEIYPLNRPPKTVAIALTRLRFATVIFRHRALFKRNAVQTVGVNLRNVGESGESSPKSLESS